MSSIFREFLEAILLALVVFLFIQNSVQNFRVEGSSMDPTLKDDQYLLVNKLVYFRVNQERLSRVLPFWRVDNPKESFAVHPPNRGEVVVFHFPRDPSRDFVKRVIGIPGDTVQIKSGDVFVNDQKIDEPYLESKDASTMGQTQLGEKEYFVLGDNRRHSNDSRNWGSVPEQNILGKVWIIYWPFSNLEVLGD
jgi:signal peptidase I